jgi:7-cyano-7-deazaguanine synthase
MEMSRHVVVLLSGGIDSSTTLAIAKAEGNTCFALSFNYGQRHNIELESARQVAHSIGVEKHLVINFDLRDVGGSALTSDMAVPKTDAGGGTSDAREQNRSPASGIPVTYVPARNTIFLSFGLGWAEVLQAPNIFIGANIVDYSGYPDCRPEYLRAFEDMANLATRASVEGTIRFRVRAPLINMTKSEIIRKGAELGLDHSLTWSCYDPQTTGNGGVVPCERCDSCVIRANGFRDAGMQDPLITS